VEVDWWTGLPAAGLLGGSGAWALAAARGRPGFNPWRGALLALGAAVLGAAVAGPLDRAGRDGLLSAHIVQHIVLADLAAPILVLSVPPGVRRRLLATRAGAVIGRPFPVLGLWAGLIYVWFVPSLHREAMPGGAAHVADQAAVFMAGVLLWAIIFDARAARPLGTALRTGGLPWWARHLYAMGSRTLLIPAAAVLWISPDARYHLRGAWDFSMTRSADGEAAASIMTGFEMMLFTFAVFLVFILVAVKEGDHDQTG
jgi:cytochrome c oxidase assembly factor CtaG